MYQTVKDMILLRLKNKFIHWIFLIAIRRMFINGKHGSLGFIDKQESHLWGFWDSWGGMEMVLEYARVSWSFMVSSSWDMKGWGIS